MFSKKRHDSAAAAVAEALDRSTANNAARVRYETDERSFSIGFSTVAQPDCWCYNIAGYRGNITAEEVRNAVPLAVIDSGNGYVVLRSEANTEGDVLEEMGRIEHRLDVGPSDEAAVKTFRMMEGSALDELKRMLGFADD